MKTNFSDAKDNFAVQSVVWLCVCSFSEVLKRLDDASCDVRLAAAHTLTNWFKCLKDSNVKSAMESHIEFLYQELLIHLDDPDQNTQNAILGKIFSHVYF